MLSNNDVILSLSLQWMPKVLVRLSVHLSDPVPIQTSVKKTFAGIEQKLMMEDDKRIFAFDTLFFSYRILAYSF